MPGQNVNWPIPLTRLPPWFPGQMGVPGSDVRTGIRAHTNGVVLYVDRNHPDASDAHDGTNPDHPLATIANAITKCLPYRGDQIAVMGNNGWQYGNSALGYALPVQEEVVLSVPGVRLVGVAPAGSVGVVWEPVTAAGAGTCLTITGSDCLVEGFSFQGALVGGTAISVLWDGVTSFADNVIIRHCLFDDDIDIGIQLDYIWFGVIHDCIFQELDAQAIYGAAADTGCSYMEIYDNWFVDCGVGAIIMSEITHSKIHDNKIFEAEAQSGAAATNLGINTSAGGTNLVYDNTLSCKLPVPAAGDYDDFCSGAATDAWIGNRCMDGVAVTNPT